MSTLHGLIELLRISTKANPIMSDHLIYAFLTCEPNSVVAPVRPKAMPVILTTPEEHDV